MIIRPLEISVRADSHPAYSFLYPKTLRRTPNRGFSKEEVANEVH
jgi:hypothetical protein